MADSQVGDRPPAANGLHARWLGERSGSQLDLRQTRRSRFVGLLKLVLPLIALCLVALVIAWPQIYSRYRGFGLSFTDVQLADNQLRMLNARYQGVDERKRPYVVTADTATQDASDHKLVTLDRLSADMTLEDGGWVSLTARSGIFHETSKFLHLTDDINVYTDRGYELHGVVADVDFNAGTVQSDQPVEGHGPNGSIKGNRMLISDKGNRLQFFDGVKVTLFPNNRG